MHLYGAWPSATRVHTIIYPRTDETILPSLRNTGGRPPNNHVAQPPQGYVPLAATSNYPLNCSDSPSFRFGTVLTWHSKWNPTLPARLPLKGAQLQRNTGTSPNPWCRIPRKNPQHISRTTLLPSAGQDTTSQKPAPPQVERTVARISGVLPNSSGSPPCPFNISESLPLVGRTTNEAQTNQNLYVHQESEQGLNTQDGSAVVTTTPTAARRPFH